MKNLAMLLIALPVLAGAAPTAPVRHLEYAFAVYSTAKPIGDYYNGTMSVDILGTAPDGGTLVQASEFWYYTLRPRQTRECEVYASGTVHCDDAPPYPEAPELALLPLLARDYFNGASSTGPASWQRQFDLTFQKDVYTTSAAVDLKSMPADARGHILVVTSNGVFQQQDRRALKSLQAGTLVYDLPAAVPTKVHEVYSPVPARSVYAQTSIDLLLLKDSASSALAPAAQPNYQITQPPQTKIPNAPPLPVNPLGPPL